MSKTTSYLGWKVDFSEPRGEPAYCSPDSVTWMIYKNPVALAVGGVAAVLLEFADPRIRSGVWNHSVYPTDPLGRSKRTGMAAMIGAYGPSSAARRVIKGVNNMHARVSGETPDGLAYAATDPALLDWVSATALYGFVTAYHRFVRPLSRDEICAFYTENLPIAALYGVETPIRRPEDFDTIYATRAAGFEPHQIVFDFLDIITSGKTARGVPKSLYRAVAAGAVSLLPPGLRDTLELGPAYDLTPGRRVALRAFGALGDRVPVRSLPAAQAAIRLGLPPSFAWKSTSAKARLLAGRDRASLVAAH
ncbi:oxygenase MpaB family protein [Maritimibacter sp. DP1N21-5]|uniref:oxygenase MpaB family protein n=1 Tax=Maritimibacter sp. DP1N21-5 TaxID=2836867 RepID=UPI001C471470|nr:oxygenase MpaB family protein [Maritimibacter sp. DP1N21-5]MBV7408401.1 DUF2236 domain-containing protein [Maritimibacter sp. DP1N21-5]